MIRIYKKRHQTVLSYSLRLRAIPAQTEFGTSTASACTFDELFKI